MRNYQKILLTALERHGWSLDQVRHSDEWWAIDVWVVSSLRENHGFQLLVTFIAFGPGSERIGDKTLCVGIAFTREPLLDWGLAAAAPIWLDPTRRTFPADIEAAMIQLDQMRKEDMES